MTAAEIGVRPFACLADRVTGLQGWPDMNGVLQSPSAVQSLRRPTAGSGLLADNRMNATRSTGTTQSLKSEKLYPKRGGHLTPLQHLVLRRVIPPKLTAVEALQHLNFLLM